MRVQTPETLKRTRPEPRMSVDPKVWELAQQFLEDEYGRATPDDTENLAGWMQHHIEMWFAGRSDGKEKG